MTIGGNVVSMHPWLPSQRVSWNLARCLARLGLCLTFTAVPLPSLAATAPPEKAAKIRAVVFDMELEDYSAGGPLAGESPAEASRLRRVTAQVREQLARSGQYEVIDPSADNPALSEANKNAMRQHRLWQCNGCEADIAKAYGADESILGVFNKVSVMEQSLVFQIRDARTGADLGRVGTDLRNETDASWSRAVEFVVQHRLLK